MPLFLTSGSQTIPLDGTSDPYTIEPDVSGATIYVFTGATTGTAQVEVSPDGVNYVPWSAQLTDGATAAIDLPKACRSVRVTGTTVAGTFRVEAVQP